MCIEGVCGSSISLSPPLPSQRGFSKYADTLLRAQERQQQRAEQTEQPVQQAGSRWDSVAAYGASLGALGVGALLAIGVRQAFS